jgi:hypothetical protein
LPPEHPDLEEEELRRALQFAAANLDHRIGRLRVA